MSGVSARFYVSRVEKTAWNPDGAQVELQAVSRGDQNKVWSSATPAGKLEMTITVKGSEAAKFFEAHLGQDMDLLITPAVRYEPGDGHPYRVSTALEGTAYGPPYCGDCGRRQEDHESAATSSEG